MFESLASCFAFRCSASLNMTGLFRGGFYEINSLTSDFSSFSSDIEASIFARLKSFIGSPCTISLLPPRTRTGNDEINPFSTP
jgi:hypothetical protein